MSVTTKDHLRHEALVGGISNTFFNGIIAWLLLRSGPALQWGGEHSFVVDIIATALLLPLIVALIVIPLQRSKVKKGKLHTMSLQSSSAIQRFANRFPYSTGKSAPLFGLAGMLVIAPLTLLGFYLLGISAVTPLHYAIFKGLWAGGMAAVMVLPMVLVALRDPGTGQV
ncbi:MAG: hypothetical protein V7720_15770 [Halioglobus sp.]